MCYMPRLSILIGLPASGKSTYAKRMAENNNNIVILSSDDLRKKWYGDSNIQGDNNKIFTTLQREAVEHLKQGHDVIYDATNLTLSSRSFLYNYKPLLEIRKNIYIEGIVFISPFEDCCKRNEVRDRVVPKNVMDKMYRRFTPPLFNEGFDRISLEVIPTDIKYNIQLKVEELKTYNQHNPHHLETLGEHLAGCYEFLRNTVTMQAFAELGWYHDIGKPYCQTFDKEGIAHYYNHECVGSYDTLCYLVQQSLSVEYIVVMANLVRWHMELYHHSFTGKQCKLLGLQTIQMLEDFNKADRLCRIEN